MLPDDLELPLIASEAAEPVALTEKLGPVSISLKYWHTRSQCISDWQKGDLQKLTKWADKVQGLSVHEVKTDPGLDFKVHRGPAARGFSPHSGLSKDSQMAEMKVSGKARVHGALIDEVFYLVWLDRNHEVFPGGK